MIPKSYFTAIIFFCVLQTPSLSQQPVEFLGLQNKNITCLSINYGILAVGTDRNGVYWQTEYQPANTAWNYMNLDSLSVMTVYAHKSGPIGWAIGAGVEPDFTGSPFIYCGFMGREFVPISYGIVDSLTDRIYKLDGFPDPTICGETYAAGGRALYRRFFTDTTWSPVYSTLPEGDIRFVIAKEQYPGVVFAGGRKSDTGALLIKSTDFGDKWTEIPSPEPIRSIDFGGDNADLLFVASHQQLYRPINAGISWESVFDSQGLFNLNKVLFDQESQRVYVAGVDEADSSKSFIYFSDDMGSNWQECPLDIRGPITDMEMGIDNWIYIATFNNGLYRFQYTTVTVEERIETKPPHTFHLVENYPNPFNTFTTIRYNIPEATMVHLSIYNTIGQEVARLENQYHLPGRYNKTWNATLVINGIYFIVLRTNNSTIIHKMLVLKN